MYITNVMHQFSLPFYYSTDLELALFNAGSVFTKYGTGMSDGVFLDIWRERENEL